MSHKQDPAVNPDTFIDVHTAKKITFYISGAIEAPEKYTNMLNTIRNSGPEDEIVIHINSYGGDLFAGLQIMHALLSTQATVTASVEGACMSAATLIFLAATNYYVNEHSIFMMHNYSGGAFGKGGELFDQVAHERKWSKNLLESVYKDFLTKKEVKSILDNKDIYMTADEVIKRLKKRAKKLEIKTSVDSPTEE
jgi:ATP-dependent protease ClpP protease subunit